MVKFWRSFSMFAIFFLFQSTISVVKSAGDGTAEVCQSGETRVDVKKKYIELNTNASLPPREQLQSLALLAVMTVNKIGEFWVLVIRKINAHPVMRVFSPLYEMEDDGSTKIVEKRRTPEDPWLFWAMARPAPRFSESTPVAQSLENTRYENAAQLRGESARQSAKRPPEPARPSLVLSRTAITTVSHEFEDMDMLATKTAS
ncbi:hypothetical protein BC940DRAFT_313282 [Gongronella butleri]|nr:hypothetical protein BC940DRAFT_313282 [Gongronella butleri]